jgi:hypothetical protein
MFCILTVACEKKKTLPLRNEGEDKGNAESYGNLIPVPELLEPFFRIGTVFTMPQLLGNNEAGIIYHLQQNYFWTMLMDIHNRYRTFSAS